MIQATEISVVDKSFNITLISKRILQISLSTISKLTIKPPGKMTWSGIVWHDQNLLLRNSALLSLFCLTVSCYFIKDPWDFIWMLLYGILFLTCVFLLLSSKRFSNDLIIETETEKHEIKIVKEEHWKLLYQRLQPLIPNSFPLTGEILYTPSPNNLLYPVITLILQIAVLFLSLDFFSIYFTLLFSVFSLLTSWMFFRLVIGQGVTRVTIGAHHLNFEDNRGKYKNIQHSIEFGMIEKLSFDKKHRVLIQRRSHKDLSDQTGLENFSHFNRIDYHFFKKGYIISNLKTPQHGLQLEEINARIAAARG